MPKIEVLPRGESNVEFVERIMTFNPYGALVQMMVIEAVARYADECAKTKIADGGMLNPEAWQACAVWIKQEMEKKYGAR